MKPPANLHLVCHDADLARLDNQRRHFYASPPEREDLALALMRYASAQVERQPELLALICRLFENATAADIAMMDGPVISPRLRASMNDCMNTRHCGEQEAFEIITEFGMVHGPLCGWQDGNRRV